MVTRIAFSLWLASLARKHVIMMVNYKVPTSSDASESEDISREMGPLRRACISLAMHTAKTGAKSSCFLYRCNIHYFLRRQLG